MHAIHFKLTHSCTIHNEAVANDAAPAGQLDVLYVGLQYTVNLSHTHNGQYNPEGRCSVDSGSVQ